VTIRQDIQKLAPGVRVELFDLDATPLGGTILYFHAGTNAGRQPVMWQAHEYQPWPIEASGFEYNGRGQLPTPRMRVANIAGAVTALNLAYDDLVGAKVTRHRTFARYLDGAVGADPTAELPLDVFYVERKVGENRVFVEYELASSLDVEGILLPLRQVLQNSCPWVYRGSECTYAGGAVATIDDVATSDPTQDSCGHRLASCRLRFGAAGPLTFGGFPGAGTI
jgi:lambda family phage minor tail protein L